MYFIRALVARLRNYFRRGPAVLCVNCGASSDDVLMLRCRMRDRCIPSQNEAILASKTDDELIAAFHSGQRPFVDEGRPLCSACSTQSNHVCYVCELEAAEEKAR